MCFSYIGSYRVFIQGVFFRMVPPRNVLRMKLVPLNRIKWLSSLVSPKATRGAKNNRIQRIFTLQCSDAVQWYSNIITQSFHYSFSYKTCETGHLELASLKNSTTYSNADLSLVFHLPHSPSDHSLLVVVDVINHMFSMTEELVKGVTSGSFGWDQCT